MFFHCYEGDLVITIDKDPDIKLIPTLDKKYLETRNDVTVCINDGCLFYKLPIEAGFEYDGRTFIKGAVNGQNAIATFLHDVLCADHPIISHNRKLSSRVYRACLIAFGVPVWWANIQYFCVDFWQRFRGWEKQ